MSEHDYQRGLRGGDNRNYEGQQYKDWSAGNKEYRRLEDERYYREQSEMDKYYEPAERLKRIQERSAELDREIAARARHRAESNREEMEKAFVDSAFNISIIWLALLAAGVLFVGGYIIASILEFLFKIERITQLCIMYAPPIIVFIWVVLEEGIDSNKRLKEAERKYGKRESSEQSKSQKKPEPELLAKFYPPLENEGIDEHFKRLDKIRKELNIEPIRFNRRKNEDFDEATDRCIREAKEKARQKGSKYY